MSEVNKSTQPNSTDHFENKFVYLSDDGELILKKTSLFDERVIASVDPEQVDEKIVDLQNSFEDLEQKVTNFVDQLQEDSADGGKGNIRSQFEKLKRDVLEADAVGDFEALITGAEEKVEQFLLSLEESEQAADDSAEQETDDAAEEKPDTSAKHSAAADEESAESEGGDEESGLSEEEEYYKQLADKAEQLVNVSDWAYVAMEFDTIDTSWGEGPDPGDADITPYREKIDRLRNEFEEKKRAHYEEQKRKREENLEKKKKILSSLQEIVDEEKWTATREVGKLKGRWDRIKAVPAEAADELEKSFSQLLGTFDDHKVDRLVKKKQKEEDNLTGKLVILEKMEKFVEGLDESSNWKEMENDFEKLAKQFRKIGRVPAEKNQEVWSEYHKLQDTFHSMRFKHDKGYRNRIEKHLGRKKKLIDEAEALIDAEDLADAARKVNKLHRRWKKAGNLPQKDENEMWDRFKAATDAFNEKKSENIDLLREQEQKNLEEKHALIEKAEELKESEDWEQTHKDLQKLMDQWKQAGPVPKRTSGKIWKKFKGAMDHFYDRRREHFKEVKEERKDNLKEKEEVLDKLRALKDHEDPIEAVNIAKPLQTEFKKAGYVPIKHKNRMWKEYREICDVIYDRFRAAKAAVDVVGRENVENFSIDDIADIRKLKSKATSLQKQISKMEQELIQKKESLSYFKPSGKSNPLLDDVKKKIEESEQEIASKEEELAEIEKKIDLIKKDDG
ncbi:MAG: DUF349 domain-containing protein [Bacteroidetes bacterium]|nr:DUF349 domain-containing protein [Bacteroidota bacterium]